MLLYFNAKKHFNILYLFFNAIYEKALHRFGVFAVATYGKPKPAPLLRCVSRCRTCKGFSACVCLRVAFWRKCVIITINYYNAFSRCKPSAPLPGGGRLPTSKPGKKPHTSYSGIFRYLVHKTIYAVKNVKMFSKNVK